MKKMHVLGMAKSNLNLKPGQATRLELDFFKLAFAVAALQSKGDNAIGYLQVLWQTSFIRANGWKAKYGLTNQTLIVLPIPELTSEEYIMLETEKQGNAESIVPIASIKQNALHPSSAPIGTQLAENALARQIEFLHPSIKRFNDKELFPNKIHWDFYGIE